jgi:hypothetical protein
MTKDHDPCPQAPRESLCMLICIFALRTVEPMKELEAGVSGIGEEQVAASAPMVRAVVVQRLEQIWSACEPHILMSPEDLELGRKPDPRFVEAGIRCNDRLIALYGLLKPVAAVQSGPGEDNEGLRAAALLKIKEIEDKIQGV